jgi:hypothetical protein
MLVYRQRYKTGENITKHNFLAEYFRSVNDSFRCMPENHEFKESATYNVNIRDKCIADIKLI